MNPEREQNAPLQEKVALLVSPEHENIEDVVEQASAVIEHRKEELAQAALALPENTPEEKLEKQNFLHQIGSVARQATTQLRIIGLLGALFAASPALAEETTWGSVVQESEPPPTEQPASVVSTTIDTLKTIAKQEAEDVTRDAKQTISGRDEKGEETGRITPALDLAEHLPFNIGSVPVSGGAGIIQSVREIKEHGLLPVVVEIGEIYLTVQTGGGSGIISGLIANFLGDKIVERHEQKISKETTSYVNDLVKNIYPQDMEPWDVVAAQPAQEFIINEKFFTDENVVMNLDFFPDITKEAYAPLDADPETGAVRTLLQKMAQETGEVPRHGELVYEYLYRLAQILVVSGKAHPGEPEIKK